MSLLLTAAAAGLALPAGAKKDKAPVPPMGWMDWEVYRCGIDEWVIRNVTDAMAANGWIEAGYDTVHIDDCWAAAERDAHGRLAPYPTRFPSGIPALAKYVHSKGAKLGIYSSSSALTCSKAQPGSLGHEAVDAATFASWNVDYLKFDACAATPEERALSVRAMGKALNDTDIVFACSWGVKLPWGNESFANMTAAGCDMWRLWHDIEAKKGYNEIPRISEHFSDSVDLLRLWSGPPSAGKGWHDPDQLIAGAETVNHDEQVAQLAAWALLSAPLILGSPREFLSAPKNIRDDFQNPELIAISRDPLAEMGARTLSFDDHEVWTRPLAGGGLAVMLWNTATPANASVGGCGWNVTEGVKAGDEHTRIGCLKKGEVLYTQWECCADEACDAFTSTGALGDSGEGCFYGGVSSTPSQAPGFATWVKTSKARKHGGAHAALSVTLDALRTAGVWGEANAKVRDVLARKDVGTVADKLDAPAVPVHGVALFRLTPA